MQHFRNLGDGWCVAANPVQQLKQPSPHHPTLSRHNQKLILPRVHLLQAIVPDGLRRFCSVGNCKRHVGWSGAGGCRAGSQVSIRCGVGPPRVGLLPDCTFNNQISIKPSKSCGFVDVIIHLCAGQRGVYWTVFNRAVKQG